MAQVGEMNLAEEVIGVLQNRQPQAAFVTEVAATIRPTPQRADMEAVLRELGGEARVLVADYASPDPHLDATDLRVVACVPPESDESVALEAAAEHWNSWLREFLRTHRCQ